MPNPSLPPLPPPGQWRWRTALDEQVRRLPARPAWLTVSWGRTIGILAAGMVVAGLIGLAVVVLASQAGSAPQATVPAAVPAAAEPLVARKPEPGVDKEVVVDVAGAVARPGLVRLRAGSRVADAVAAAGGPKSDADMAGLNQARVVADGEQVRVPHQGEAPPVAQPGPGSGSSSAPASPSAPINLNRATLEELDVLPGVGPATAAAIITWREHNGGFRQVEDLLEVPGIGPARLERLRSLVQV